MLRHRLIPAPSYDILSNDWHQVQPIPSDPVLFVNDRIVEPIPFNDVYYKPRSSDVNDRPSLLDRVFTVWWPGQSTWQEVHKPLTKSVLDQPLASMPQGTQLALGLRSNIRNPSPYGQGELSDAADELYPMEG